MYRLNCNITDEAEKILKEQGKRYGTSLGTIVTMLALGIQKEGDILAMTKLIGQAMDKQTDGFQLPDPAAGRPGF